ncbi:hypothetical protein Maes01_02308 [Microbulbifer aestuariivivens]|uniref:Uncharacterized protein n=1 Tax=Microbulbifer aestuariivivens TaxID=1908308 RepID=A0ABP9WR97_9GAMM
MPYSTTFAIGTWQIALCEEKNMKLVFRMES